MSKRTPKVRVTTPKASKLPPSAGDYSSTPVDQLKPDPVRPLRTPPSRQITNGPAVKVTNPKAQRGRL